MQLEDSLRTLSLAEGMPGFIGQVGEKKGVRLAGATDPTDHDRYRSRDPVCTI